MGLLVPIALSVAGLSLPILFFYVLKLRRPEQVVSSTMLWQQVLRDQQANAPWQRLRRNLLLLLQLLLLFLLVLALARPYSEISTLSQGNAVVLLDASASMQATDVRPSRFEVARDRARQLVDGLGPNDTMTLIAVADVPRVLASVTNDRAVLRQALAEAQVSNTEADWEAVHLRVPTYPIDTHRLVELPDGRILGTAGAYEGNFLFDPAAGKCTHLGKIPLSL